MTPFTVNCIDHVVFRVADLDRSIAFYRTVLGCEVVKKRPDLGLVHMRAGTSMIDFIGIDGKLGRTGGAAPGDTRRNVDHLCLRIDPFDEQAIHRHLETLGLRPTGAAAMNFGAEGVGPSLYLVDPDGNTIELKGPAMPDTDGR